MNSNENNDNIMTYTDFICFRTTTLARKISRIHNKACSEYQITTGQSFILIDLLEHDNSTMTEVANRVQLDTPAITRYIDRLIKESFVTREEDSNDRRLSRISLTEKGKEIAVLLSEKTKEVHNHIASLLSEDDYAIFDKCLAILQENL